MIHIDIDKLADAIAARLAPRLVQKAEDPWLGEKAAAEHLGVSVTTFKRYKLLEGFPQPQRPAGGRPKYSRLALDEWKAGQ